MNALIVAAQFYACRALAPECEEPPDAGAEADFRVISYNIGNSRRSGPYALRIEDQAYEDYVGGRIRELEPDLVLLQEVLTPERCETFEEDDPARTCFEWRQRPPQAKRLLGDDYSVACDANRHVECIGVRVSFGSIRGVAPGGFGRDKAQTTGLPGRACDYLGGECDGRSTDCDAESSVSTIVVDTQRASLRIIHVHPTAIGEICLQRQLDQAFAFVDDRPTVMGGDWNADPSRLADLPATAILSQWIGDGKRFRSHSGHRSACRFERTSVGQDASLDRVITDFALGRCEVWAEPRLDDGFDFSAMYGSRADHFAVHCDLDGDLS